MATSGEWDNDDEDDEQNYSAEEMDIDAAPGGSLAASGVQPLLCFPLPLHISSLQ